MKKLLLVALVFIFAGCSSGSDNSGTSGGSEELLADPEVQKMINEYLEQNPEIVLSPEARAELEESLAGIEKVSQDDIDTIVKATE